MFQLFERLKFGADSPKRALLTTRRSDLRKLRFLVTVDGILKNPVSQILNLSGQEDYRSHLHERLCERIQADKRFANGWTLQRKMAIHMYLWRKIGFAFQSSESKMHHALLGMPARYMNIQKSRRPRVKAPVIQLKVHRVDKTPWEEAIADVSSVSLSSFAPMRGSC